MGDRYFTDMQGFFGLVVVHGGEERTRRLVPGKPEEVTTVVCSLKAFAKRWRFKSWGVGPVELDYSWEALDGAAGFG